MRRRGARRMETRGRGAIPHRFYTSRVAQGQQKMRLLRCLGDASRRGALGWGMPQVPTKVHGGSPLRYLLSQHPKTFLLGTPPLGDWHP